MAHAAPPAPVPPTPIRIARTSRPGLVLLGGPTDNAVSVEVWAALAAIVDQAQVLRRGVSTPWVLSRAYDAQPDPNNADAPWGEAPGQTAAQEVLLGLKPADFVQGPGDLADLVKQSGYCSLVVVYGGANAAMIDDIQWCTDNEIPVIALDQSGGLTDMWRKLWFHNATDGIDDAKLKAHLETHRCPVDKLFGVKRILSKELLTIHGLSAQHASQKQKTADLKCLVRLKMYDEDEALGQAAVMSRRYRKTARHYSFWRGVVYFLSTLLIWGSEVLSVLDGKRDDNGTKGALFWPMVLSTAFLTFASFIETHFGLDAAVDAAGRACGLVDRECAAYCTRTQHYSTKALADVAHRTGTELAVVHQRLLVEKLASIRTAFNASDALIAKEDPMTCGGCMQSIWDLFLALVCCQCRVTPVLDSGNEPNEAALEDNETDSDSGDDVSERRWLNPNLQGTVRPGALHVHPRVKRHAKPHGKPAGTALPYPSARDAEAPLMGPRQTAYRNRIYVVQKRLEHVHLQYFWITVLGTLLSCGAGLAGTILAVDHPEWTGVAVAVTFTITKLMQAFRVTEIRGATGKAAEVLVGQWRLVRCGIDLEVVVRTVEDAIETTLPPARKALPKVHTPEDPQERC